MVRTIITMSEKDKKWLEEYSYASHLSVAETIRRAIREYREHKKGEFQKEALSQTAGLWKSRKVDGLKYVGRLRDEWKA